jgi:hypothetical protein
MKRGRIILSSVAFVAAISGAFAFKALKFPRNLFYLNTQAVCVQAPCTSVNYTGATACTNPSDFSSGYYTNNTCTSSTVQGFTPNEE